MTARNGRAEELFQLADADLADLSRRTKLEIQRRTDAATINAASAIVGLEMAKRVVTVAAAGKHSVVFVGREGSGKTCCGRWRPSWGSPTRSKHGPVPVAITATFNASVIALIVG